MYQPQQPDSPNQQIISQFDLQQSKQALSRKIALRPTKEELVAHGILPSSRVPNQHYYEQKRLQKAKIQDYLKKKVEQRPDRELLVQKNILSETRAAPALHISQRQLKRARLVDDLNDKLLHRPGPLELVEHGILESNVYLTEAIKDGSITFPRLSDVFQISNNDTDDNDSNSSTGLALYSNSTNQSPLNLNECPQTPSSHFADLFITVPSSHSNSVLAPFTNCMSLVDSVASSTTSLLTKTASTYELPKVQNDGGGKIKKAKIKKSSNTLKKANQLIFHEYKGPNQKSCISKSSISLIEDDSCNKSNLKQNEIDSYNMRLEQQKVLLNYDENKYAKTSTATTMTTSMSNQQHNIQLLPLENLPDTIRDLISKQLHSLTTQQQISPPSKLVVIQPKDESNMRTTLGLIDLESMSKIGLIEECKRRGIPSSGRNKQRLIDDIRANILQEQTKSQTINKSPDSGIDGEVVDPINDEKARIQRQIEELNRKLNDLNNKTHENKKRSSRVPQQKINQMLKMTSSAPSLLNQITSATITQHDQSNDNAFLPSISSLVTLPSTRVNEQVNENNIQDQMEWNDADLFNLYQDLQTNDNLLFNIHDLNLNNNNNSQINNENYMTHSLQQQQQQQQHVEHQQQQVFYLDSMANTWELDSYLDGPLA